VSRLFLTERGRVLLGNSEEITRWRWVRKQFELPAAVREAKADHLTSDCVMAGHHVANGLGDGTESVHPVSLLRKAYGI
jgi:hypothetical protein